MYGWGLFLYLVNWFFKIDLVILSVVIWLEIYNMGFKYCVKLIKVVKFE